MLINTVSVVFIGTQNANYTKEYAFLTDLDLKPGELVVVDTINGFSTAKVSSLFADEGAATRWVVCSIDTEAFNRKLVSLKKRQLILKKMKRQMDSVNMLTQYEIIAKNDKTMAALFEELKSCETRVKEITE